ncbi:hypothetical protein QR685DRAFT_555130 [Neurospora intermedia]|uniref:Uncharacterized protein n=1 Tax=Neurospora intermedia TaxID=5142 RepID=A0ABR3D8J8_NEUIN
MKFQLLVALSFIATASARPIVCPDAKRDAILKGDLPKEACCSYGRCLGDVVIASS